MIEKILSQQVIDALGWTLLHSLWQGAVFAILLAIILIALRKYTANARYTVSVGVLGIFFLTTVGTFWQQYNDASPTTEQHALTTSDEANLEPSSQAMDIPVQSSEQLGVGLTKRVRSSSSGFLLSLKEYYTEHLPLLMTIWLLGVLFFQLRFLGQLVYVQRLKHYGTELIPTSWHDKIKELEDKLRIQKKVKYLSSIRISSPMVVGWFKPVVLMPRSLMDKFTETEIYAILAHELAHIRRDDFLVNLLQTFFSNIFFFHPGVWWINNRIDDEREHSCDDLAVAATGPAMNYAKTLISVQEYSLGMTSNSGLAVALSGKRASGFTSRIHRLFVSRTSDRSFREGFASALILLGVVLLGLGASRPAQSDLDVNSSDAVETSLVDSDSEILALGDQAKSDRISDDSEDLITSKSDKQLPVERPADPERPAVPSQQSKASTLDIDRLIEACAMGELHEVQALIQAGLNVNSIGSRGFTALMMAASADHSKIVEYLVGVGADVNLSHSGWTALIESADEGSLKSMEILIKAGAKLDYYRNPNSPTALTMTASEGHLACMKLLQKNGADLNGTLKSFPPLHSASEENKIDIVEYLIEQGVDIDKQDALGRTALMYASSEGNYEIVNLLISAGADISIQDRNRATAQDYAEDEDHDDILSLRGPSTKHDLHEYTRRGKMEKVIALVDQGADINQRNELGQTVLHIAAQLGYNLDMRQLIGAGAEVDATDREGRTAMMLAAAEGKYNAVTLLVAAQADVDIADHNDMRAYEWALSSGELELITFLALVTDPEAAVKYSVDPQSLEKELKKQMLKYEGKYKDEELHHHIHIDIHQDTHRDEDPQVNQQREELHVTDRGYHLRQYQMTSDGLEFLSAVREGSLQDVRRLIESGTPINITDATGQTGLMAAASSGRVKIAEYLIAQGANVNAQSRSGLSALHYAALEDQQVIAELIIKNGGSLDLTMSYSSTDGNYQDLPLVWQYTGATPLLIAVESNHEKMVALLIAAGAQKDQQMTRTEYRMKDNRESYLTGDEVMGFNEDFLHDVELRKTDTDWSPRKQAQISNNQKILRLF